MHYLPDWAKLAWKPPAIHMGFHAFSFSNSLHLVWSCWPCGLLFEWIFSCVSGAISQRIENNSVTYAADLPHRTSPLIYMNSTRGGQGPNQVQALHIDFLKVLSLLLQMKSFNKIEYVWCLVIWVYWSSSTVTAEGYLIKLLLWLDFITESSTWSCKVR